MILLDYDDRLIATNDEATVAVAWSLEGNGWLATHDDFARKAFAFGDEISPAKAKRLFPDATLDEAKKQLPN